MHIILDSVVGLNGIRVSVVCDYLMAARCGGSYSTSARRTGVVIDIKMDIPQYLKRK